MSQRNQRETLMAEKRWGSVTLAGEDVRLETTVLGGLTLYKGLVLSVDLDDQSPEGLLIYEYQKTFLTNLARSLRETTRDLGPDWWDTVPVPPDPEYAQVCNRRLTLACSKVWGSILESLLRISRERLDLVIASPEFMQGMAEFGIDYDYGLIRKHVQQALAGLTPHVQDTTARLLNPPA